MRTPSFGRSHDQPNWTSLPDPVIEEKYKSIPRGLQTNAQQKQLKRRASPMGFASSSDYLRQALAAVIAGDEEDTVVTRAGRFVCRQNMWLIIYR